jgi:NAD(P)-dependent dehydrogenase (short-subunit alcohol dehydrogenase family)
MQVNVKAPFELAKMVYPSMKSRGGGSLINISSIAGHTPDPGLGMYSVSKASLNMLTKVLAKEWGQDGIRVNAIAPGLIKHWLILPKIYQLPVWEVWKKSRQWLCI